MNKYQDALDVQTYIVQELEQKNDVDFVWNLITNMEVNSTTDLLETTLQELVDKATPRKPNTSKITRSVSNFTAEYANQAFCPNCNTRLNIKGMCCPNNDCRQKIDWSKDDNPNRQV